MAKKKNVMDDFDKDDDKDKDTKKKVALENNVEASVIKYVLNNLGTPKNLVKVEAYNYTWGETKNRWRVNVVVEEEVQTELGSCIPAWRRHDSFFLHFDEKTKKATYCNPPIERKYS